MKRAGLIIIAVILYCNVFAQRKHSETSSFTSYKGLVMAGYQGWFNAEGDGAGLGWRHYLEYHAQKFTPGNTNIDMWPDVSEYEKTYITPFKHADGTPAYVFSSWDYSSVDLHFKWMQQYGIDGVFVQRFIAGLYRDKNKLAGTDKVLNNALTASAKYNRAIAVMYDFSGMENSDYKTVIEDWKHLVDDLHVTNQGNKQTYLYHNGKPLVVLWGVGFGDGRAYTTKSVEKIMDFLQNDPVYGGCAIMLGIPTYWRDLSKDTDNDPHLHDVFKKADILNPWFVGRIHYENYGEFYRRIQDDMAWCKQNNIDYAPVIYPGMSMHNMTIISRQAPFEGRPRYKGNFFWKQIEGAITAGAQMLYVAMFDEVDEGTAITKVDKNPPVGASNFVKFEDDIPNDYYLYLTGFASKLLKKQVPLPPTIPLPPAH